MNTPYRPKRWGFPPTSPRSHFSVQPTGARRNPTTQPDGGRGARRLLAGGASSRAGQGRTGRAATGRARGPAGRGSAAAASLTVIRHHRLSLVQLLRGSQMVLDALELRRQRGKRRGRHHGGDNTQRQQQAADSDSGSRAWRRPLPLPAGDARAPARWAGGRLWRGALGRAPPAEREGWGTEPGTGRLRQAGWPVAATASPSLGPYSLTRLLRGSSVLEACPTAAARRGLQTREAARASPGPAGGMAAWPRFCGRPSPPLPIPLARQPKEPWGPCPWRWSCKKNPFFRLKNLPLELPRGSPEVREGLKRRSPPLLLGLSPSSRCHSLEKPCTPVAWLIACSPGCAASRQRVP